MSADADHEVIDSPEALFRHLYEAHHVEEALDLDPETAPVHFWLRRHAELEREARSPRTPAPAPAAGRRPAAFGDPLVEAVARALAGRGHDETAVRGAIRAYTSPAGGRTGEAAVRGDLVEPMLRAAAERLLGAPDRAAPPPRAPAATPREDHRPEPARPEPARPEPARPEPARPEATRQEATRQEDHRPEPARPEAAWAGLFADLGDGGSRRGAGERAADAAEDDLMALADAVQRRPRPRRALRR
jgi:hypothetical protein